MLVDIRVVSESEREPKAFSIMMRSLDEAS